MIDFKIVTTLPVAPMSSKRTIKVEYFFKILLGWGVQAYHFEKKDFELGDGGEGQDTSRIVTVVLGPYVQYCPCEASEQNWGKNQNLN